MLQGAQGWHCLLEVVLDQDQSKPTEEPSSFLLQVIFPRYICVMLTPTCCSPALPHSLSDTRMVLRITEMQFGGIRCQKAQSPPCR